MEFSSSFDGKHGFSPRWIGWVMHCISTVSYQIFLNGEPKGHIKLTHIARASLPTTHLMFADDSLFFCKADVQQSQEIINITRLYGETSGQQINLLMSSVVWE